MAEKPKPAQPNTTPACFIFGAGPFYGLDVPPAPGDLILAADGGYRHCCTVGLQPHLLLGDFDSLDVGRRGGGARCFPRKRTTPTPC